jgi:dipeptidyl aminopeptidase/acylaminoacyl peptidase
VTARITPAMVARSHGVADPRWAPGGARLGWIDSFDGRSDLVVAPADLSAPPVVVTADCAVGGGWCWSGPDEVVVAARDGRLLVLPVAGGEPRVLSRDGHAAAPAVSARGEVAFTLERDDAEDVAVVPLDGSAWPVRVSRADFAWDAAWSPDGSTLAWHEWDLPDMPWDASRVVIRRDDAIVRTIGGDAVSLGQPRFSPDGSQLAYISDSGGWPVLCVADADGSNARVVLAEHREHAEPSWSPGQRSFAWSPDGSELAWCRNEDGFGRLVIAAPGKRSARELSRGWHRGLDWGPGGILCVRSGAVTPPQVVALAANGSGRRPFARGPVGGFDAAGLVEPRAVTWKSGSATVHGLLWRPAGMTRSRPLLVMVHGGPTSQALADWNARVQGFVQRGWTVLQAQYRGSSGYGRAYTQSLAARWGERDVSDVAAGIRQAEKEGWADTSRVALMGGSAGGLTVLLLAAQHPDLVHAVVAIFPVCDLLGLAAATHRLESGYTVRLVGPLPAAAETYRDRSPLARASEIRAPVLLLHGDKDDTVPVEQSEAIAAALRTQGVPVERHVYEGEGHGWRRATTIADESERIDTFLSRWVLPRDLS